MVVYGLIDLGLKWCKKIFYQKISVVQTIQEKKILFHYTLNGMV
jgi:hypothetical protein